MLVNTIMKESAVGANLKAEIIDEHGTYCVKYYINGTLNTIARYKNDINQVNENVENWFNSVRNLNG